jgi:hypothetical protein
MRFKSFLAALAVSAASAAPALLLSPASAAANPPRLAPQFGKWSIPIYPSRVTSTITYAPTSYGIETTDAPATVLTWYRTKLKARVMEPHQSFAWPKEFIVDSGNYVIHFSKFGNGTEINVIRN